MEQIKKTIEEVIKTLQECRKKRTPENDPETLLKKNLSKKELAHIKFNYYRKGVLGIKVDSSSWLYYLSLQKEQLSDKLRRKLAGLKHIHFCLGEIDKGNGQNKRNKK